MEDKGLKLTRIDSIELQRVKILNKFKKLFAMQIYKKLDNTKKYICKNIFHNIFIEITENNTEWIELNGHCKRRRLTI